MSAIEDAFAQIAQEWNALPLLPTKHMLDVAESNEDWDALSEQFDADWKAAYVTEFVQFALFRSVTEENARVWASETCDDAIINGRTDPAQQPRLDVGHPEIAVESAWFMIHPKAGN